MSREMTDIKSYDRRVAEMKEKLGSLLMSPKFVIKDVAYGRNHDVPGVYLIIAPDGSEVVYAGKTNTKTIAGRMKDHLSINTTSDLRGMLRIFPSYPQEKEKYLVRYAEVQDSRDRTIFEHFLIAVLNPPFNK